MEFEIFHLLDWCLFYLPAVLICSNYMGLGWRTVEPTRALELPRKHHGRAFHMGYVFAIFIAMVCADIQVYTHLLATPVCLLPYLPNLDTLLHLGLNLFWVDAPGCEKEGERDIYRMEFGCLLYLAAMIICDTHMCLGWQQVVPTPALELPMKYHGRDFHMSYAYASFPIYTHLFAMPLYPPPYLLNLDTPIRLNLFGAAITGCEKVAVQDIHHTEFEIFQFPDWCLNYLATATICSTHRYLGWRKVVPAPASEIPKKLHGKATHMCHMGYVFAIFVAMVYVGCPATLLILCIAIRAVGNLHILTGPDDFNGCGIVEVYTFLPVPLHVFVGLERTWDTKLALVGSQDVNVLSLVISGLISQTFFTVRLWQLRFGDADHFGPYYIKPPPYLINCWGISSLNPWTNEDGIQPVGVSGSCEREFQFFTSPLRSFFYTLSVHILMHHPENTQPNSHAPGSRLFAATFENDTP